MPVRALRLGVNIDHVATLRNARGGLHPDPLRAAHLAIEGGADGITAHLREDRRHISDADITRLKNELTRPLNLEMAATNEMLQIAIAACAERVLPSAGTARGAHDRRRPRRRRRGEDAEALRRQAEGRRHPGIALHRARLEDDRGGCERRRRHRRASYRPLLQSRARPQRCGRRSRTRAAQKSGRRLQRRPASKFMPGTG